MEQALIESLSGVLEHALTQYPGRYLAMLELALENTLEVLEKLL